MEKPHSGTYIWTFNKTSLHKCLFKEEAQNSLQTQYLVLNLTPIEHSNPISEEIWVWSFFYIENDPLKRLSFDVLGIFIGGMLRPTWKVMKSAW